jgi:predicted membrane channel-forming protein YqfA (hemolysin III family)
MKYLNLETISIILALSFSFTKGLYEIKTDLFDGIYFIVGGIIFTFFLIKKINKIKNKNI